jgi:hypothetical protein
MVHGIRSSGSVFANFKAGLEAEKVLANDLSINLVDPIAPLPIPAGCPSIEYNKSIEANVIQLQHLVPAIAERFGSETIHFVAHSKGGLDTRGFLSSTIRRPIPIQVGTMGGEPVRRDLEGRSLVTLDTPYSGSVLAQYGVEARQLTTEQAWRTSLDAAAAKELEGAYYCDLQPIRASAFTGSTRLPDTVQSASVASDADCNGDRTVSPFTQCDSGSGESEGFPGGAISANRLYQLVGTISTVTITVTPMRLAPDLVFVTTTPTALFKTNDAIVSQESARAGRSYAITGSHHLNVHSRDNAATIATDAQGGGLIDWRKR